MTTIILSSVSHHPACWSTHKTRLEKKMSRAENFQYLSWFNGRCTHSTTYINERIHYYYHRKAKPRIVRGLNCRVFRVSCYDDVAQGRGATQNRIHPQVFSRGYTAHSFWILSPTKFALLFTPYIFFRSLLCLCGTFFIFSPPFTSFFLSFIHKLS